MDDPLKDSGSAIDTQIGGSQDPQGNFWVTVRHMCGPAVFTYGLPLDQADEIADNYARLVHEAAAQLRRKASGLIVARAARHNGRR